MRQRISARFLGQPVTRGTGGERVCQLAQRGQHVHNPEAGHGTAHEVVGEHGAERGQGFNKVIAVPERGPRNQDQQQPRFEQERDQ